MALRGTVISGTHNVFTIECSDGIVRLCAIKGKVLRHGEEVLHNALAPGDEVEVMPQSDAASGGGQGLITALVPRRNGFFRWNDKTGKRQVLAANVDAVLLVTTIANPPFRPRFIDRALVQCDSDGLMPWIVCNKCDLDDGGDDSFNKRVRAWQAAGVRVFRVSALDGTGAAELQSAIAEAGRTFTGDAVNGCASNITGGKGNAAGDGGESLCALHIPTAVLAGQSGVGKSSLVNALCNKAHRATGSLCTKYDRGSHTTAMGCLIKAEIGGSAIRIIDTPGVRRFTLHGVAQGELAMHFLEMLPFVGKCRYGMSCTHTVEDGCAIRDAVAQGKISYERYDSYLKIRGE